MKSVGLERVWLVNAKKLRHEKRKDQFGERYSAALLADKPPVQKSQRLNVSPLNQTLSLGEAGSWSVIGFVGHQPEGQGAHQPGVIAQGRIHNHQIGQVRLIHDMRLERRSNRIKQETSAK
jgi:hypothetical protein